MPICSKCTVRFDGDLEPGALMYGHPKTTAEVVPVWKANICQKCETEIVDQFLLKPKKFTIIKE